MTHKQLDGIKVVDFSTYVAAPSAAHLLQEWGAEVIKVEGAGGEPYRPYGVSLNTPATDEENPLFLELNAGKKAIGLNLKTPEGLKVMYELLEDADVFISNIRPRSLEKLGLGYEKLQEKFPRLIYGHVSGYGTVGSEKDRPGFDIVAYWARSGFMADLQPTEGIPYNAPQGIGDHITGLSLATGILASLYSREQTGKGDKVQVSLYHTAIYVNALHIIAAQYGDTYPKSRYDASQPLTVTYETKDKEWIQLSLLNYEKQYKQLCEIMGLENYIDDERYNTLSAVKKEENTKDFVHILEGAFGKRNFAELNQAFSDADFTYEKLWHYEELSKDEQAIENNYFSEFTFKNGNKAQIPTPPVKFGKSNDEYIYQDAPLSGEHNKEILSKLGYSDDDIQGLIDNGALVK